MNWKDIAHYGTAGLAIAVGGVTELGIQIPGVVVSDPKMTMSIGVGILVAGLKNGWTADATKTVVKVLMLAFAVSLFLPARAEAADVSGVSAINKAIAPTTKCQSAADCSGWYADFGLLNENVNFISTGLNGAGNDFGIMAGGGYQLWKEQLLAGIQLQVGYEFAGQGVPQSGSRFFGTALVQLGYNFFPQSASPASTTTPGQSPFANIVPANLLAASTPYINAGGCLRHDILQGCAGVGLQTVIAAGWSTAFDYLNMPSKKGMPDDQVFTLKILKHF